MNPKQRSRGRGNNGGNPNRSNFNGGGHGGGGPRHINVRTQVFDSNGPEGRIRGNAHQVMEKYLALARDASSQGDRVSAENFYQHAEHYFRLINAYNLNNGQRRPQNLPTPAEDQNDMMDDEDEEMGEQSMAAASGEADDASAPMVESEQPVMEAQPEIEAPVETQPQPEEAEAERPRRAPRGERRPRRPRAAAQPAAETDEPSAPEPVVV